MVSTLKPTLNYLIIHILAFLINFPDFKKQPKISKYSILLYYIVLQTASILMLHLDINIYYT